MDITRTELMRIDGDEVVRYIAKLDDGRQVNYQTSDTHLTVEEFESYVNERI